MPFTLAHPAVLFPLLKKNQYFSATALVVGSMVPDIEFIAQMHQSSNCAHHFPGIFLINIPLGIMVCFLFHAFVKKGLIENLPIWFRSRFQFSLRMDWIQYALENKLVVVSSLAVGILSHIALDAFTHEIGFFVQMLPILKNNILVFNNSMPIYHFLQIISSVIGLTGLLQFIWKLPNDKQVSSKSSPGYWLSFLLLVVMLIIVRFEFLPLNNEFWDVVLAIMGIGMYSLILCSSFHSLLRHILMKVERLLYSQKSQA